jgi:uncharacterized protein (DUF2062 family)
MPKKLIKKWLPDPKKIKENKSLGFLGEVLHEPNLWHINRHGVSKAFLVGIFICLIPIPFQMAVAAVAAVWINCNLPISVALCWITNPVTMPIIFYFNYWVGALLLRRPPMEFEMQLSFSWLAEKLYEVGLPLYVGSLVVAALFSLGSYLAIEFIWRRKIRRDWAMRKAKKALLRQSISS